MECKTCGKDTVVCNCSLANWNSEIRRVMRSAKEAAEAYEKNSLEDTMKHLGLRDRMKKLQGEVVDLQWAYFQALGVAKAA